MHKSYFMARGRVLRIEDAAERVIHVRSGALWVTQEGDRRDYYLPEGSALRVSGHGLAVAQATRPSTVVVTSDPEKRRTLAARLAKLVAGLYVAHARPSL